MGRYRSSQTDLTVNQVAHAFVGAIPTRPTTNMLHDGGNSLQWKHMGIEAEESLAEPDANDVAEFVDSDFVLDEVPNTLRDEVQQVRLILISAASNPPAADLAGLKRRLADRVQPPSVEA